MRKRNRKSFLTAGLTPHPDDTRVAETLSLDAFERFRLSQQFEAAVLHRFDNPRQSALHKSFKKILKSVPSLEYLDQIVHGKIINNHIRFESFPQEYDSVKEELEHMAETYFRMTGIENIELLLITDPETKFGHAHPWPALNCTWLKNGTIWLNVKNKLSQIAEGNWFFFNPGFEHGSPVKFGNRLTTVIKPDERFPYTYNKIPALNLA